MSDLAELVEAADLNALLRAVDGLCEDRDWGRLVDLADMCEEALERGKQLWPIADHIDYRLALEAPGDYAGSVLGSRSVALRARPPHRGSSFVAYLARSCRPSRIGRCGGVCGPGVRRSFGEAWW